MILFELENNVVTFSPQALLISPFKKIWDADKTDDKEEAAMKLGFIYYFADDRSPFLHILDTDERIDEIKLFLDLPEKFNGQSEDLLKAIHYYQRLSETTSTKLLGSTRLILQKISEFLDNVNMDERDEKSNKPIHDIGKITSSVEKIPKLIKAINEIEKEVIKEKALKAQSGNKSMGMFDDGGI